ncbi:MAG: poly-gamma-glutamate biosynthesis protein PgsC/CapC, partial [Myxococcota bacterium]
MLIGLFVVWAFQETLGWNFTGLVVPGYLASIFTIHPATGMVVVSEALVTVSIVLLLSERVPAWWPWTRLFGRDRFFLFLLTSVAVRIALEGGGFDLARQAFGLRVEEGLHSMGLVLVPLLANAFWRAGAGGMPRVAVPVLLTWALLEWVFVPFTNLSLSSFELTYEDLALNFVGSPRAYILLLIGAAMGSWANQRWGWDYGGIIVPGLLALCWSAPASLAATIGEAVVIAALLKASFRLPVLRTANLTGGRPLVLAFTLGYLTKFAMGWAFGGAWPGFAVRDLYGFGYLLSSIVALRIVKHGEPFRSVVPALVTSLGAFVGGSAVAWGLAVLLPAGAGPVENGPKKAPPPA